MVRYTSPMPPTPIWAMISYNSRWERDYRRQIPQGGVSPLDGATDAGGLVHAEVIRDDDVARPQRGHQDLVDVGQEAGAVDRAIEDARRG